MKISNDLEEGYVNRLSKISQYSNRFLVSRSAVLSTAWRNKRNEKFIFSMIIPISFQGRYD